ncbi:MAG: Bor family protein [Bacteroidetes bacterium]|nr:Bor family protein [Bacteroidota bacterium]
MVPLRFALLFVVFAIVASGCYHSKVVTGRTPGPIVIDEPFASGWVYGLVPPSTVEAASECPDGVAIVETELSFVNQLVGALTGGIYTPMHIKVTCAATESTSVEAPEVEIAVVSEHTSVTEAFKSAADEAVALGEPIVVHFAQP